MRNKFSLGMLLGLIAGSACVYYFYVSKSGKRKRLKIKWWMIKAKAEIYEKLEELENITRDTYDQVVDSVLKGYKNLKDLASDELAEYSDYLKSRWEKIKERFEDENN